MSRAGIARVARLLFWAAAAFCYAAAVAPRGGIDLGSRYDKVNHVAAFLALAVLARFGWPGGEPWIMALLLVAFGGFIELSQALPLVHRDAEWADLAADAGAAVVGLVVASVVLLLVRRRRVR